MNKEKIHINYKFSEDEILEEIRNYIRNTYSEHYSGKNLQAADLIFEGGHGEGFCIGNIIKYAHRFGKKNGKNEKDLIKIIHYAIMAIHNLRQEQKPNF